MKSKIGCLFWLFMFCWFLGAMVFSVGLASFFPALDLVSKPLVCPHGQMSFDRHVYRPYPGTVVTTITWYCVDESSGAKTQLSEFPIILVSGAVYGLLLFVLALLVLPLLTRGAQAEPQADIAITPARLEASGDATARMQELSRLRTANLISEVEYEEKRKEILKSL